MITPQQAEQLAKRTVTDYVNQCGCRDTQDAANALMKLASMCGLAMCATVGQQEAVARMQGTLEHVKKPENAGPWKRERQH